MKVGWFVMLTALFCYCMSGCKTVRYMKGISQVSYTSESGTILPELQWYEQIVITRNKVTLARNGKAANTEVNAGTWEFAPTLIVVCLQTSDGSTLYRIQEVRHVLS